MASFIPGYEYDIFISYRQKDNKYDGWVTEFVDHLKTELEATFKEDISVYFDTNPHDGLLETHDVNESLKEKLRSLVFIPIISQTYCDPNSFAWEHEFNAFVKQASEDHFGLKIKLPNGNVANRVLPVQIHDLDNNDTKLCESVLGGVLRGIEFIFKSPGVNRPLLSKEENPQENLNHTNYRDQINKVANAIKETIAGLKITNQIGKEPIKTNTEEKPLTRKNLKTRTITVSLMLLAIVLAGFFILPKLLKSKKELDKSIAVLPFFNDSPDNENTYFINGVMDEILNRLEKIKDFRVLSRTSTEQYRNHDRPSIPKIAKELNVNYIVEGSGQKYGNQFILRVQLIAAENERHLWSKSYKKEILKTSDIFEIHNEIAQSIATELDVILKPEEKKMIEKIPTTNLTAYDLIQKALYNTRSDVFTLDIEPTLDLVLKAIELDPSYADAYAFAGIMTIYSGIWSGTKSISAAIVDSYDFLQKALKLDPDNAVAHFGMGHIYEWGKWDYIKAESEYLKSIESGPLRLNEDWGYQIISEFFLKMNQMDKALIYNNKIKDTLAASDLTILIKYLTGNKEKAQNLLKNVFLKMDRESSYISIASDYIWMEQYDSAKFYFESAINTNNPIMSVPRSRAQLALSYFKTNDYSKAKVIINQLKNLSLETIAGSPDYFLGWYYSGIGEIDSAFYWLEKAYKNKSPEFPYLKIHSAFNPIKNDPRYWDLYKRTGHLAYDEYKSTYKK